MQNPESIYHVERLPSVDSTNSGWDIIRALPDGKLSLVSVARDFFGIRTHFWKNRTGPCLRSGCDACAHHHLSRWHGYLECVRAPEGTQVIFEFPPPAAMQLDAAVKEYGGLRGLQIVVTRATKKPNGKVTLQFKGLSPGAHKLPKELPIWPILSRIWGMSEDAPGEFAEFTPENLAECEKIETKGTQPIRSRGDFGHIHPDLDAVCNSDEERDSLARNGREFAQPNGR